jgi:hypothetical protein
MSISAGIFKGKKVWAILSPIVGVLGILLAIIFYLFPFDQKSIRYSIQNYPLFKDYVQKIDGMQILLYGNEIKTLTVSNIAIWNSGRSIIEHGDIPQKNPLAVKLLGDGEIIKTTILYQTSIGNDVNVSLKDNNYAVIDFDYMDKNDGFILQIIHTENNINVDNILGEIKGLGQIKNYYNLTINFTHNIIFLISSLSVTFIITYLWVYFHTTTNFLDKKKEVLAKLLLSLFHGILVVIVMILLLYLTIKFIRPMTDPFKISVPNNLKEFFIPN